MFSFRLVVEHAESGECLGARTTTYFTPQATTSSAQPPLHRRQISFIQHIYYLKKPQAPRPAISTQLNTAVDRLMLATSLLLLSAPRRTMLRRKAQTGMDGGQEI